MLTKLFLSLASCASIALAAPYPLTGTPQDQATAGVLQTRAADPNACPGYSASNIIKTASSLTADLTLAGAPCNIYSEDIKDLKLVVEYQTGKYSLLKWNSLLLGSL